MNLLIIHAEKFSYTPKTEAPKAILSFRDNSIRKPLYFNSLIICITIDKNDNENKLDQCHNEIIKIARDLKCFELVIMPVSHLTAEPKDARTALDWLLLLRQRLNTDYYKCYLEPFGFAGNWKISSKSHKKSVLGRFI